MYSNDGLGGYGFGGGAGNNGVPPLWYSAFTYPIYPPCNLCLERGHHPITECPAMRTRCSIYCTGDPATCQPLQLSPALAPMVQLVPMDLTYTPPVPATPPAPLPLQRQLTPPVSVASVMFEPYVVVEQPAQPDATAVAHANERRVMRNARRPVGLPYARSPASPSVNPLMRQRAGVESPRVVIPPIRPQPLYQHGG